jgi:hypothetical protein
VASWEKGKFKTQGEKKAALVALRKVRGKDVKKMLAEKDKGGVLAKSEANIFAEVGADLSQVSILARREIEARILMPVLNAFIKEHGKDQTVKLVDPVIQELAREGGVQLAKALGGNTIAHFAKGLSLWTREDALRLDVMEQTEKTFAFNVTRCRYAEMYKELGVQEYGSLLSCGRDAALIVGFNPKIKFTRTQTIMSGAPYCDFRYELMG